jgi:thymidine kinase
MEKRKQVKQLKTYKHKIDTICPYCGRTHKIAADIGKKQGKPEDGALLMCLKCGEFGVLDKKAEGGCRKPSQDESISMLGQDEYEDFRVAWELMVAETGGIK